MKSYSVTDVGQKRTVNQDYVYAQETPIGNLPNLFVVADGMGGHNAGDFASSYVVQVLKDSIREDQEFNPIKLIRNAIETANTKLIEQAKKNPDMKGMGTTIVVVTVVGHYAYIANVGDSRMYVQDESLQQITRDHSLVEEMVRLGEISREDARNHPDKNVITRAIGASDKIKIDFFDYKIEPGAIILMCSDGLTNMIEDSEISRILETEDDIERKGIQLVKMANENGGKDNIGIVLIEPFTNEVEEC